MFRRALISVFYKDHLDVIVHKLAKLGVEFVSTGGTQQFIEGLGYKVTRVEDLTGYPSIFGGRVKTLHPAVFGGILYRRDLAGDVQQAEQFKIGPLDLVIVDLYPFEETVAKGGTEEEVIEKIDIGGISLIRAAAKNFNDVLIVSSREQYGELLGLLEKKTGRPILKIGSDSQQRRLTRLPTTIQPFFSTSTRLINSRYTKRACVKLKY